MWAQFVRAPRRAGTLRTVLAPAQEQGGRAGSELQRGPLRSPGRWPKDGSVMGGDSEEHTQEEPMLREGKLR